MDDLGALSDEMQSSLTITRKPVVISDDENDDDYKVPTSSFDSKIVLKKPAPIKKIALVPVKKAVTAAAKTKPAKFKKIVSSEEEDEISVSSEDSDGLPDITARNVPARNAARRAAAVKTKSKYADSDDEEEEDEEDEEDEESEFDDGDDDDDFDE